MIRILNLGGGVQSTCIARMSMAGELPLLDHIIFADTGGEWPATYETVAQIEADCPSLGIGFHRVQCHLPSRGPVLLDSLMGIDFSTGWSAPPLFTINDDGSKGFTSRQCTSDYKRDPILRKTRELAGIKLRSPGPRHPVVESWLGISSDEKQRMKTGTRWQTMWHPLIEGPRPMNRHDCQLWLERNGHPTPTKSACFFCPYQSNARWRACRDQEPILFAKAIELDHRLRQRSAEVGLKSTIYLHRQLVPLDQADLRTPAERGQGELDFEADGFDDECHGVCGV